jgi:ketosteroid isomerase-like protein
MRALLLTLAALSLGAWTTQQSSLDQAIATFDRAWRSGDAGAIASMMDPEGIRLQLGEESHSLVAGRQARAAVAMFREARAAGTLELQQAAGGDASRASAVFRWQTVVQGTSENVQYTIFVEFTRTPTSWLISAIRVS